MPSPQPAKPIHRSTVQSATVAAVYRHTCAGAIAAAIAHDWPECRRLSEMARLIAKAYPAESNRARFSMLSE